MAREELLYAKEADGDDGDDDGGDDGGDDETDDEY